MNLFGNAIRQWYGSLTVTCSTSIGTAIAAITNATGGAAITLDGVAGGQTALQFNTSGTPRAYIGLAGAAGQLIVGSSAGDLALRNNGTIALSASSGASEQVTLAAAGNVSINAPSSGTALQITAAGASTAININGPAATNLSIVTATQSGQPSILLYNPASTGDFRIFLNSADRLAITAAGNVSINAPSSGTALSISNGGSADCLDLNSTAANTATIQSFLTNSVSKAFIGVAGATNQIITGAAAGDLNIRVDSGRLNLSANGSTSVGAYLDSSGNLNVANGTGTLSPVYAGIPQNSQGVNYTFVLTDANKHIFHNVAGAHTYTIPANASVAYPIGTAITICNPPSAGVITLAITSDSLVWTPSGTTGSRSLAANSVVTIIKVQSTQWLLSGVGIT